MELGVAYAEVLPTSHRRALAEAAAFLMDLMLDDLASPASEWSAETSYIASLLPPRYLPRYTLGFARKFFVCVSTVVWKLGQHQPIGLSCVAEELAAHVLIGEAEALLEDEYGEKADFGTFEDVLFEDLDFELLYSNAHDGIEESELGGQMGVVNLVFPDWFKGFRSPGDANFTDVHLYVHGEAEDDEKEDDERDEV
jgi:hypothetical protein